MPTPAPDRPATPPRIRSRTIITALLTALTGGAVLVWAPWSPATPADPTPAQPPAACPLLPADTVRRTLALPTLTATEQPTTPGGPAVRRCLYSGPDQRVSAVLEIADFTPATPPEKILNDLTRTGRDRRPAPGLPTPATFIRDLGGTANTALIAITNPPGAARAATLVITQAHQPKDDDLRALLRTVPRAG